MWALIITVSCYYGCHPVILPERYNTRAACEFVGKRATKENRSFSYFYCINTDATGTESGNVQ